MAVPVDKPPPQRPGFSFLVCPDTLLATTHLEQELAEFPPSRGQWERHAFWGDEEPPQRFWEQLHLQNLFGARRVLVVHQAQLWTADVWKKLSRALAHGSEQCWPFFLLEVAWEKGKAKIPAHIAAQPCFTFADRQGWVWRHQGLTEQSARSHINKRIRELHLSFTPDQMERFCASVPHDARSIENELQKLALLHRAGASSSFRNAGGPSPAAWWDECDVFACIRHMENGNLPAAFQEIRRSRDNDGLFFSLSALLSREMRLLWQAASGENPKFPPSKAGAKKQLARRIGQERLAMAMAWLADAEMGVKSGQRTPEQSLDMLAVRITGLFRPSP